MLTNYYSFTFYEGDFHLVLGKFFQKKRATDQIWTGDLILTKDALYQLSYCSFFTSKRGLVSRLASAWFSSGRRGSNPPPIAWKAIALPNELLPLLCRLWGRVDSNHWTPKRTDLQSVAIATMRLPHLYFPKFPGWWELEPMKGLEPPTGWLQISYSTNWVTSAFYSLSNNSRSLDLRLQRYSFFSNHPNYFYFFLQVFEGRLI